MFDPLSSSGGFADDALNPPWPTTPHTPNSPIPGNLRRASTPVPPTPDKGPAPGPFGKEPQIYGQPDSGLISPREAVSPNGANYEKPEPYLRVRITGLDRNRRDILVKLDAQTNLSNFTGNTYRNVSRSYLEFQQFYDSVVHSNPQTIIPALPLAQTSAPTDEEDDRLVKIMLQRWITRVCEDPILVHDEDVRAFIESDFGYQPTPRPRRKTTSSFGIMRRGVPDEDEDLQRARFELTKLEGQFFDTAKAVDKLSIARKSLAVAHAEMGNKLINVATTEAHPPLGNAFRKIGRTWHSLADLDQAQAISECVILGDSLGYQGMNARSAKETLLMRTGVLEEYQAAVKTTISKRRQIERLKASSNIRPDRVDEALEDMEEANKYEQVLARRAQGISQNLHQALETHNRYANDDITTALIEHTRSSIMYERQLLRELEALRVDVAKAADKYVPPANGVPKPPIPVIEEYHPKPPSRIAAAPSTAAAAPTQANGVPQPQVTPQRAPFQAFSQSLYNPLPNPNPLGNPGLGGPLGASASGGPLGNPSSPGPPSASSTQAIYDRSHDPLTPSSTQSSFTSHHPSPSVSASSSFGPLGGQPQPQTLPQSASGPLQPQPQHQHQPPHLQHQPLPQSPGAGPSSPSAHQTQMPRSPSAILSATNEPPLGGRLVEGSKSMFIKPPSSSGVPPSPLHASQSTFSSPRTASPFTPSYTGDPLLGGGGRRSSGGANGHAGAGVLQNELDPLGQVQPTTMSASVRAPPQRPRLDAREAAKSLANMF
ncbi:Vacuolar protein sorting-associated protein 17 [Mycena venus]|uniref:Vacuolar protein sorting-associated protein 17 n=1 Tax=Mycena venus TaxID=2733690 RepID=A0A8H6Y616_9AGAR|nr:Vacuolar protein sorting-associated protein 17 [Mycena venus]